VKISLIENGLDSLEKAYDYLGKYEEAKERKATEIERFFMLKDVTLAVQHGVEILFKCVLRDTNEILLYSDVNSKLRQAYKQRREGEINELYELEGVYTVSFKESIERLVDICNVNIEKKLKDNLLKVEKWRNSITHSSASLNEFEVSSVLSVFMKQLDVFFAKNLGDKYTHSHKKKYLDQAFNTYVALHGRHSSEVKHEAMRRLVSALENHRIKGITTPGVFLVNDAKTAYSILAEIQGEGVVYGFDMANLHCSGKSKVLGLSDDGVLTIWGIDNLCEYQIGLSGIVVYIPEIEGVFSPLIYIYSSGLAIVGDDPYMSDFDGFRVQKGFRHMQQPANWSKEDYMDLIAREEESEAWLVVERFISGGCTCFMNVQQLEYGNADKLMTPAFDTPEALYKKFQAYIEEKRNRPKTARDV